MKKKIKSKTKAITTYLTDEVYDNIFQITEEDNISFNTWMRDAINQKLDQDKNPIMKNHKERGKDIQREWNESFKEYKDVVEQQKYENWVKKGHYFSGLEGY